MEASFIIPLYNCLPLTQAMLESLVRTLPRDFIHEIIWVDDGSSDGTREWLRTLTQSHRVVLNESNRGFAASCNRGVEIARGHVLFFINNDLVFLDHWLAPMLAAFRQFPDAGLVGNVQINALTGKTDHSGIFFNHKGKPAHLDRVPLAARWSESRAIRRVDALTGACFAISRNNWHLLGGFDEGFVNGSEDIDLCLRAASRGFSNYVALRSRVRHHISSSAGRKLRDEQNSYRLEQRWRTQIARLMAPAWCRHQIATNADQSHVLDYAMLGEALLYLGGARSPGPRVAAGVEGALIKEELRWREILESVIPAATVSTDRTDYI